MAGDRMEACGLNAFEPSRVDCARGAPATISFMMGACGWISAANQASNCNWVMSFGPFRVSKARRLVERGGEPVNLGGRAFDILSHLLEHHGQVVTHHALLEAAWPSANVGEGSLRFQIAALRKALREGEAGNSHIMNVASRGYCFVAPVSRQEQAAPAPAEPPSILPCLAKLLESVRTELDGDREVAKAHLVRAASLLRIEIQRRAVGVGSHNNTEALAALQIRHPSRSAGLRRSLVGPTASSGRSFMS